MSLVMLLDAVKADGIVAACVTGVTPVGTQIVFVNTPQNRPSAEDIQVTLIMTINIDWL